MKSLTASVIAAALLITSLALSALVSERGHSTCIRQATPELLADYSDPTYPPPPPPPTFTDDAA
jgi:hypothetical protein